MKIKSFLSIVFAITMLVAGSNIQAQNKHKHPHPHAKKKAVQHKKAEAAHKVAHKNNMSKSIVVIKRTNHVINNAHKAVKKYKVYTGSLAKAFHHQQYAKMLLKQHKSHRAMQHSRLARKYAFKAIRSNKGTVNKEYNFTDDENKTMGETISDAELEKELKGSNPNILFEDDRISDKEMTELEVLELAPSDYKNE